MQMIIRGFSSLLQFSGRDTRSQFWPYAGVVVVAGFALIGLSCALAMQPLFEEAMRLAQENPEAVTVQTSPTGYSVRIDQGAGYVPDFSGIFSTVAIGVAVLVGLLAAAVTRRLHDRGLPAFWGLLPLVFLTVGMLGMQKLMAALESPDLDTGLFFLIFANNLFYLGSLGWLVVQLAQPSQPTANRHGPVPSP